MRHFYTTNHGLQCVAGLCQRGSGTSLGYRRLRHGLEEQEYRAPKRRVRAVRGAHTARASLDMTTIGPTPGGGPAAGFRALNRDLCVGHAATRIFYTSLCILVPGRFPSFVHRVPSSRRASDVRAPQSRRDPRLGPRRHAPAHEQRGSQREAVFHLPSCVRAENSADVQLRSLFGHITTAFASGSGFWTMHLAQQPSL